MSPHVPLAEAVTHGMPLYGGCACVGYRITDCYYGDLFSPAVNLFPEHFLVLYTISHHVHDSIAFNQKEFCVGPCIAADVLGETRPPVGVMGYWVDNCFVLHAKLLMSLQRGKAAQKSILSI
jgi:hypothetical protein